MKTTASPSGLFNVLRFQALVYAAVGQSYERALYDQRKSDLALDGNTVVLIKAIAKLHQQARAFAGRRPIRWQTASGVSLPDQLEQLIAAIVKWGAAGPDRYEFIVEWTDSVQDDHRILLDLSDYFWFIDYSSRRGMSGQRAAARLELALATIKRHFAELATAKKK